MTVVQKRLDAFAGAQQVLTAAHGTVEADEALLQAKQPVLFECNTNLDESLEALASWMATDGYKRGQRQQTTDHGEGACLRGRTRQGGLTE